MEPHIHGYKQTEENTSIFKTMSSDETFNLASVFAQTVKPCDIVVLQGDLGVGKTVFAKGLASGLGIEEIVTSPTYTIVSEYSTGKMPLYHFDMYRIGDVSELEEIGFYEYINGDGVVLIEWPEMVEDALPEQYKLIKIDKNLIKGENYREIRIIEINN